MKMKMQQTLPVSALALAVAQGLFVAPCALAQSQAQDTTVVVTGMRASARNAMAIKKDSVEIVDSITAEDIGKLPDLNVAETLTRVPGVQGYRYGGEGASPVGVGSGLTIRGLSGQTASQVNGRAYFTAGGREYNIEGAIPAMIAGVDVYKNPTAEHIEGGIGGLVNIRTRNPSDFKGPTVSLGVSGRYNDLAKEKDPELFGLVANKWTLEGGGKLGVMAAAVYQSSTGRSDNNPANGGANFKRAVRADSAEYQTLATANTGNRPNQPMASYVGRTDVSYLANVPTKAISSTVGPNTPDLNGLTTEQAANVMTAPAVSNNAFQETIMRVRRGLNLAADYRHDNTLRFFTEFNYTYYLYHQNYRGLNSVDGANVQNLTTTPFAFTEGLANRNLNGGSNDVLATQRLLGGTALNSTVNTVGGDEHTPYTTWIAAGGADWNPTPELAVKAEFNYIKSKKTQDNRAVNMDSKAGLYWNTTRLADGAPHQLNFSGPNLGDASNFVFRDYANGTNVKWDDKGSASAISAKYTVGEGFLRAVKTGARYATQESRYNSYSFSGKPLTVDGLPLNAARSNGISADTLGVTQQSPTNFMDGDAGYGGGYVVYAPGALLGSQVATLFPKAGIPMDNAYVENVGARRYFHENTLAGYLMGEFAALDDRITGNAGVRVVRTQSRAVAMNALATPGVFTETASETTYTNALPTLNVTGYITPDFLARFGYGKGLTRAPIDQLNPTISVNPVNGTGNIGNPALRPQTADSFDLSLERYFSKTNYVSAALFDKEIDGFFNGIVECQTVAGVPAYSGSQGNSCGGGQYQMTKSVNSEKGNARGVEVAGQYFFDSFAAPLRNFGVAGSYTYVKTSNPVNFGTAAAPRIVDSIQPFQSKNSYSVSGMYEDTKWSARLVYTWRSDSILFGASANPIDARGIAATGILDGSINYNIDENFTVSFNASNILDKALNRFVGEPGAYQTGIERQHYANGRTFSLALRYKYGK
ncbi:TonB-dependent receptor [Duganella violaceipulchra]|uniref:TonB-dependent receptor n=1 Tax=Duganella violaceipulchra TaxID=2849652 RepID=A0AA41H8C1_9BURK|nr:TonB-dependent receptor [Duganella violaceicalia]MBV6319461.1 TonB-dependent receptor [Duganella violaceicalia]MCP2006728.1 TonB-dependent receptor [Duganella violaceicalia]